MTRVCPHSDAECKHGMSCPYTCATDAYNGTKALLPPAPEGATEGEDLGSYSASEEAAPSGATASWRDIESAPKDGTRVLVFAPGTSDKWDGDLGDLTTVCAWHPDAGFCVCELREVTHWLPLPHPPNAAAREVTDCGGWRPIENAPKDLAIMAWPCELEGGRLVAVPATWYVHQSVRGWVTDVVDCGDFEFEPTHWVPLPNPPAPVSRDHAPTVSAVRVAAHPATINLNDSVRVTLTAAGVEMMRRRHNGWAPASLSFVAPSTEEPTTFQLWMLMQEFGPDIGMGLPLPFTSTELEIVPAGVSSLGHGKPPSDAPSEQNPSSQPSQTGEENAGLVELIAEGREMLRKGSGYYSDRQIREQFEAVMDAASRSPIPGELLDAATGAAAKLEVARQLMQSSGWWTNEAGYMTDAALWIDRALGDLRQALAKTQVAEGGEGG